jgi:hypothetical protein
MGMGCADVEEGIMLSHELACFLGKACAGKGRDEPMRGSLEQGYFEDIFELLDLQAERSRGSQALVGGLSQRPVIGDCDKCPQQLDVDVGSQPLGFLSHPSGLPRPCIPQGDVKTKSGVLQT